MEDPIPLDELLANGADLRDGHGKAIAIIRSSLAIVSIISSSTLIWMVKRSNAGFNTSYHRILLGMSIADILYSLSIAHFNVTAPRDMSYMVWNAIGNQTTCNIQGTITTVGAPLTVFYSCSLNLYSLIVVKYQKTDQYIKTKIEPFLHCIPIVLALSIGITLLANENTNPSSGGGGNCYMPVYEPPHCIGYSDGEIRDGFEIPCGRGREGAVLFAYLAMFISTFVTPIIVGISLGMIYRTIRVQEMKLARYGASTLHLATTGAQSNHTARPSRLSSTIALFKGNQQPSASAAPAPNNNRHQRSRVILKRALDFSLAYTLAWSFNIIGNCFAIADVPWPVAVWYLSNIFNPLQGVFNFMIFMHPKWMSARQRGRADEVETSWCRAFVKAFWSRGIELAQHTNGRPTSGQCTTGREQNTTCGQKVSPAATEEKIEIETV